MPLVNLAQALEHADKKGYAIGAFNTLSIKAVEGALRAAEEFDSPIILQVAPVQLDIAPLKFIGSVMLSAAKWAKVPVVVNFDHGEDINLIKQALDIGFTSVMFDGALLSFEDNVNKTKKVVDMAHSCGASCEAELGVVGIGEDCSIDREELLTKVDLVKEFVQRTNVDALAVAIGNAHGPYAKEPKLRLDRLDEINNVTKTPLVLHGGSGISKEDFQKAIKLGIQKINVATALQQKVTKNLMSLYEENNHNFVYDKIYESIEHSICDAVKEHMDIFMSQGQALSFR